MKPTTTALRVFLALGLARIPAAADAGPMILYQGTLHDPSGKPKTGTFLLNFEIRSADRTWSEGVFVRARGGSYRATLGAKTEIPDSLLSGDYTISAQPPLGATWSSRAASQPKVVRGGQIASGGTEPPSENAAGVQPPRIDYEGTLEDGKGRPISGTYLLRFQIFPGVSDGKLAWESAHYVRIENGRFHAKLGEKRPLPLETLRGTYRITAAGPAGLDWAAKPVGIPVVRGIEPAPTVEKAPGDAASGALERVRREMRIVDEKAREAQREAEASKKRIQALENRLLQSERDRPEPRRNRIYVVKSGDTLRSISRAVFGTEDRWIEIYQANHDRVLRGGEVVPGQKLLIPPGGGAR